MACPVERHLREAGLGEEEIKLQAVTTVPSDNPIRALEMR